MFSSSYLLGISFSRFFHDFILVSVEKERMNQLDYCLLTVYTFNLSDLVMGRMMSEKKSDSGGGHYLGNGSHRLDFLFSSDKITTKRWSECSIRITSQSVFFSPSSSTVTVGHDDNYRMEIGHTSQCAWTIKIISSPNKTCLVWMLSDMFLCMKEDRSRNRSMVSPRLLLLRLSQCCLSWELTFSAP
jgi:hypothetical protein